MNQGGNYGRGVRGVTAPEVITLDAVKEILTVSMKVLFMEWHDTGQ